MAPVTLLSLLILVGGSALAGQPARPLPRFGSCPIGFYSSGSYCVPSASDSSHGAIVRKGGSCPIGYFTSGNYCVSSPANEREAIEKLGSSCPIGWYTSGAYCVRNH